MPGYISFFFFFLCLSCNVWWLGSGRWSLEHRWQCVFILTWQGLITSLQPSHWQQFIYPQLLFLEHLKPECLRCPVGWSGFFFFFKLSVHIQCATPRSEVVKRFTVQSELCHNPCNSGRFLNKLSHWSHFNSSKAALKCLYGLCRTASVIMSSTA